MVSMFDMERSTENSCRPSINLDLTEKQSNGRKIETKDLKMKGLPLI